MIIIEKPATWPKDIARFMEEHSHSFIGWECKGDFSTSGPEHDRLVTEFGEILKKYSLHGYHCTRLTEEEIINIRNKGLTLQNRETLCERINKLQKAKLINKEEAMCLVANNQSGDRNRANMLWFCFFPPREAGENGIERFFRHWGGEALYNSHEDDPVTGERLQEIGIPCVVEAMVPLKSMPDSRLPDRQFIRAYLKEKGYRLFNGLDFEGYIIEDLASTNVIDIHQFSNKAFLELTGCAQWENPLTSHYP